MLEIAKLLRNNNIEFFDNNLAWGAKLSDYQNQLKDINQSKYVVGIELWQDIDIPQQYRGIDHHNENSEKPSSLEQIADLLGIKLSRYQQLVAENDKGYIDAMLKFGATKNEIEEIRKADRKSQGVTDQDERLAEESIKNLHTEKGVAIIKSLTDKFSPICDRLYYLNKLIIYTEQELNYYGISAQRLGQKYQERYGDEWIYYGGGKDGYFGFSKGYLTPQEIQTVSEEVVKYVGEG